MGFLGALIGCARAVAGNHLPALPAVQPHQVDLVTALSEPPMRGSVPELVGVDPRKSGFRRSPCQHLPETVVCERPAKSKPETVFQLSISMLSAGADIPVDGTRRAGAKGTRARATALADHMEHLLVPVDILNAETDELCAPHARIEEHTDGGMVSSVLEVPAFRHLQEC